MYNINWSGCVLGSQSLRIKGKTLSLRRPSCLPLSLAGDVVLSGCSTLSLLTATLQQLNHVFELYLGPWGPGQTGFVALPSHPTDSPVILQLQFLFDVLQKTLSLKVLGWERGRIYEKPRRIVEAGLGCSMGARILQGSDPKDVRAMGGCAKKDMPRKGRCAKPH